MALSFTSHIDSTAMRKTTTAGKSGMTKGTAVGRCVCGAVHIEIDLPAFWAWHDHSKSTQRAQGCAYATYIGCWRSKVRVVKGEKSIRRYEDKTTRTVRSFCAACGTPVLFERAHAPKMVNLPRALFETRTGREPRYHLGVGERPEWAYGNEKLVPLKGYPGVMWTGPGRKNKPVLDDMFVPFEGGEP